MKKYLPSFLILFLSFFVFFVVATPTHADELDDITKKINELNQALSNSKAATAPLESQLKTMVAQINDIKNRIVGIENDVAAKKKSISVGYEKMAQQQEELNDIIRTVYTDSYYANPLLTLLLPFDASDRTKQLMYQQAITDQNKQKLTTMALVIQDLETKKRNLEDEEKRLATAKVSLDEQSEKLDKTVAGAKTYQSELSGQIAQLSAQQQQLLGQKLAALNIPRSAGTSARGCSDDRGVDPGFSPRLAFFTYGAPHRNGLNQYGAWGRAKMGQNEEQILQAYYPNFSLKKDYDQGAQVNVDGHGTFSIEDYVKRIYEVPDSWTDNNLAVLKAQAVAARSYALNSMQRNGHICTTESCQVFKPEPKGGNWEQAVEATKGWVLMDGSNPAFSQYASTHGGYILNLGKFDGDGDNPTSFAQLNERAFDKASPWFYCDWGARSQYANTAWLKPDEVADIVNVILLAKRDSSVGEHLYQPDKPPAGKDVWSAERVKSELRSRGGTPYNTVSDVSASADFGSGKTTSVNVSGDGGSNSFNPSEFKDWFNLRAPANIQIVGPLYNIEKQ